MANNPLKSKINIGIKILNIFPFIVLNIDDVWTSPKVGNQVIQR